MTSEIPPFIVKTANPYAHNRKTTNPFTTNSLQDQVNNLGKHVEVYLSQLIFDPTNQIIKEPLDGNK